MRYEEHYGSAYNFEVGYLEALRNVSIMLANSSDLEVAQITISEWIAAQREETKAQIPEEDS